MWPPTHFIVVSAGDGSSDSSAAGGPGPPRPPLGKSHNDYIGIEARTTMHRSLSPIGSNAQTRGARRSVISCDVFSSSLQNFATIKTIIAYYL